MTPTTPSLTRDEQPQKCAQGRFVDHCVHWYDSGGDADGPLIPCCFCGYNGEHEGYPCKPLAQPEPAHGPKPVSRDGEE